MRYLLMLLTSLFFIGCSSSSNSINPPTVSIAIPSDYHKQENTLISNSDVLNSCRYLFFPDLFKNTPSCESGNFSVFKQNETAEYSLISKIEETSNNETILIFDKFNKKSYIDISVCKYNEDFFMIKENDSFVSFTFIDIPLNENNTISLKGL